MNWSIEDLNGVKCDITTKAYFVPSAKVWLFSPQVYIRENLGKSSMHLDPLGLTLTVKCGIALRFPIGDGNNLPFMLTTKEVAKQRATTAHQRKPNNSFVSFLTDSFVGSITLPDSLTDYHILQRNNLNLTLPQQELALWHQR